MPVTGILPERYVSAHGVKKSHLIETAVLRHLCASDAIPTDLEVPRVILVSRTAGKLILDRFETPKPPTPTMRVLHEG